MKTIKAFAVIVAVISAVSGKCQSAINNAVYTEQTIYLDEFMNKYIKNNQRHAVGFFGHGIETEFTNTTGETAVEFHKYKKKNRRGKLLVIAGGTLVVTALVAAPMITLPVFAGLALTGLVPYGAGCADMIGSRRALQRAVWLRNRDVLLAMR